MTTTIIIIILPPILLLYSSIMGDGDFIFKYFIVCTMSRFMCLALDPFASISLRIALIIITQINRLKINFKHHPLLLTPRP